MPQIAAVEPADAGTLLHGITKMIVPSIMQCSKGGFIVVIPGVGLKAATNMQEVMSFVEQHANSHFKESGVIANFPKVLSKAAVQSTEFFAEKAKRVDMVGASFLAIGILGALLYFASPTESTSGEHYNGRGKEHPYSISTYRKAEGPSLGRDSGSGPDPFPARASVLPEVYVREVRTTPYNGEGERTLSGGRVRQVRPSD
jgi:hypothetical protein